ncbi:MAG: VOC family protein [Bryobacteraceae bacterium]
MPEIEKHAPGSFCWFELATTDQKAAKNFYTSLFGWTVNEFPMGPGEFYSIFQLQGRDAAAGYTLRPEQRSQGVPPHWMIYVTVESADESAKRATAAGGKALAEPFNVFDMGRMAVLQDPTGVVFSIWQPMKHQGAGVTGSEGTFCWADLSTPDPERAMRFYTDLFGWKFTSGEDGSGYLHIANGEDFIGGVPPAAHRDPHAPPHWLSYFAVSDCDGKVARAKQLGAAVLMAPMSMENVGRMSIVADPQGAVFAVFQEARRG